MASASHVTEVAQKGPADMSAAVRVLRAEAVWRRQEAAKGGMVASSFDRQADALSYAANVLERLA